MTDQNTLIEDNAVVATPSPIEQLEDRVASLEESVRQLMRITEMQAEALRALSGESARSAIRVMAGIFGGLAHQLEHAVEEADQHTIGTLSYVPVTDASERNHMTVVVGRNGDQINFSMADSPDNIQNDGMDSLAAQIRADNFLEDGERKLINISQVLPNDPALPVTNG